MNFLFLAAQEGKMMVDTKGVALFDSGLFSFITNSLVVSLIAAGIIFFICRKATHKLAKVPGTIQNILELFIDAIYGIIENMLGPKLAKQAFPLLATMFFFLLVANWLALIPGVGTIGWGQVPEGTAPLTLVDYPDKPLLRPPSADLNMGLPLAFTFMVVWLILVVKDNHGIKGFLAHLFAPKGKAENKYVNILLIVVFIAVGFMETISMSIRPFSLALRLYGNVFAGENLLHVMADLGGKVGMPDFAAWIARVLVPIPFYFLEILIGFLQAVVFTMLCTVYIQLSAHHEDHGEQEHAH